MTVLKEILTSVNPSCLRRGLYRGLPRALTLGTLCFKFLFVVGLKHRLSQFWQESAKFMAHDGWQNSARSWILSFKPGSNGFRVILISWWRYLFKLSDLIADNGAWYFQVCQGHSVLWMPQMPFHLRVLALTSKINLFAISVFSVYDYPVGLRIWKHKYITFRYLGSELVIVAFVRHWLSWVTRMA